MRLSDALFNWLQMWIVLEARPTDHSAKETIHFFTNLLKEDHHVTDLSCRLEMMQYIVTYRQNGEEKSEAFPKEAAEQLLQYILSEPKYN